MDTLVYAIMCAGLLLGFLTLWWGIRGKKLTESEPEADEVLLPKRDFLERLSEFRRRRGFFIYLAVGVVGGISVGLITGWPIMGIGIFISAVLSSALFGSKQDRQRHIAKTEAIATWTEMVRDTISGAAGLEEALTVTGPLAPIPIAKEVRQFLNRLEYQPLDEALVHLGRSLKHPSADLVVVSLVNATRMQAQNLGDVLSRLAESIRGDVRMRVRVEVGRAKIITSSKLVVGISIVTIVYLLAFARGLLEPYETLGGQLWLLVVFGVFWIGGWLLHHYGQIALPERFLSRLRPENQQTGRSV